MPDLRLDSWLGLDLRRNAAVADPRTLSVADNVSLTIGGGIERRDALVKVCDVSSSSVGLFSANGALRTVVPGGQSLQDTRPAEVIYEPVGDGAAYGLTFLTKFHAVEVIASSGTDQAYPYVVIENSNGKIEHHWLTARPALTSSAVNTKIDTGFDPGTLLAKASGKLYADDPASGNVRFSSIVNGPTDWTFPRDAGTLPVRSNSVGDTRTTALGIFDSSLAVMFGDAVQLWDVAADPSKTRLRTVLNGPGTDAPGTVENVLGDLFYLSRGGFRDLRVAVVTGQPHEGGVGSKIQEATKDLDLTTSPPISLWSQARSQYLCAVGTKVFAYTLNPTNRIAGWTTWDLPVSVTDLVEHDGELFVRSGNTVYKFVADVVYDHGGVSIPYDARPQLLDGKSSQRKRWNRIEVTQTGKTTLSYYLDEPTRRMAGPTFTGPSRLLGPIPIGAYAHRLGIGFAGTQPWKLEGCTLYYDILRGSL